MTSRVSYSYKARTKEEEFEPDRSPELVHHSTLGDHASPPPTARHALIPKSISGLMTKDPAFLSYFLPEHLGSQTSVGWL